MLSNVMVLSTPGCSPFQAFAGDTILKKILKSDKIYDVNLTKFRSNVCSMKIKYHKIENFESKLSKIKLYIGSLILKGAKKRLE